MPSGKTHETINILLLIPAIAYLGHLFWGNLIGMLLSGAFVLKWLWNTFYFTPDLDTKSRSRKRLWFFGWIIDKCFRHRGISHSVIAWSILFGVEYMFLGWASLGGVVPVYSHIILDKVF